MTAAKIIGRYAVYEELASGGMASVHLARLRAESGFSRTVAVKRLHRHFANQPDFTSMLIDEARMAGRVRHPNVVQTLDVVRDEEELLLVMDYVPGESLARLLRAYKEQQSGPPVPIVARIIADILHGLHAAHEATDERGAPLHMVHRDVSPQNIMVGADGVSRVLDFGVAKATGRIQTTRDGQIKGKLRYMAPEQLSGDVSPRTDLYAVGVVLWEALTGRPLFKANDERELISKVLFSPIDPPRSVVPDLPPDLDALTMRALEREPSARFATAREMAELLEKVGAATWSEVATWVHETAGPGLERRAARVREIESATWSEDSAPLPRAIVSDEATNAIDDTTERMALDTGTLPAESPAAPKRKRVAVTAAIIIALSLAASAAVVVRRANDRTPATSEAAPLPAASQEPDLARSAAIPSPSISATAAQSPSPAVTTSAAVQPARAPSPLLPAPRPRARPSCDPPFRLGPKGEKIWIPECL